MRQKLFRVSGSLVLAHCLEGLTLNRRVVHDWVNQARQLSAPSFPYVVAVTRPSIRRAQWVSSLLTIAAKKHCAMLPHTYTPDRKHPLRKVYINVRPVAHTSGLCCVLLLLLPIHSQG